MVAIYHMHWIDTTVRTLHKHILLPLYFSCSISKYNQVILTEYNKNDSYILTQIKFKKSKIEFKDRLKYRLILHSC